jgi:hypothetical protein
MLKPSSLSFPCWLTGKNKLIAEALLKINFCYCGLADDFCEPDFTWNCEGWTLGTSAGLLYIDAIYDGAVFFRCLEVEHSFKNNDRQYFDCVLKQVKRVIRTTGKKYKTSVNYFQLSIFN